MIFVGQRLDPPLGAGRPREAAGGSRSDHEARREDPRAARSSRSGSSHRFELKLVNPANKRKFKRARRGHRARRRLGRGHAWPSSATRSTASASTTARAARTRIAAQGGINAAKNYQNDGDSVYRLFYDTIKGGDFRAREANVYRLAEVSASIIDQCVAQGVPFAREYGGHAREPLLRRRAGLAHVLRARPDRPAAAARLLRRRSRARSAPARCAMYPRTEMLDVVVAGGRARGIVTRAPRHREDRDVRGRRRGAGDGRLQQRLLPLDEREGLQRRPRSGAPTSAAPASPTRASRRSTRRASRRAASTRARRR